MLTFAAAVVGVAVSVGCGDASVGEMPSPILVASPRATMTPEVAEAETWVSSPGNSVYPAVVGAALGVSGDILPTPAQPNDASPQPLPPVPTAMVAAQITVPPAPPPDKPRAVVVSPDVEQWRGMVEEIFPAHSVETVLRIMRCESGGNPGATGGSGEMGLMQIHPRWHPDATYDPYGNLLAAYRISGGGTSWGAWTCR
jgi:hypothetical protein